MDIRTCLEKGYLKEIKPDEKLVKKELDESKYDLGKAKKTFEEKDFKWGIVKSYYAMFHSARALLFKLGLREKRHFAISIVLEDLNKQGKLENKFVNDFNAAVSSREDADYHYTYSRETAEQNLQVAEEFLDKMNVLINDETINKYSEEKE